MSESLNVLRIGRYEARVKDGLATVPLEADRQGEIYNPRDGAGKSLREAAGLNESEPICSIVSIARSNAVIERAEPVCPGQRQYRVSHPVWMHGRFGVTGLACGEGYPQEDGRGCAFQ